MSSHALISVQVALKTVVDEVSTLAVEQCLLEKLPSILSTDTVLNLTDEEVQRIAGESAESMEERAQATRKLAVLEEAMKELKRLKMHRTTGVAVDTTEEP